MTIEKFNARMDRNVQERIFMDGKVGAGAGWTVRAAANSWLATVAASQTAGTLVIPLHGLKPGDRIRGYHLLGQIESAGNAVTLDAQLYRSTVAAADVSTAAVGGTSMTQLSKSADSKINRENTKKEFNPITVGSDETYFLLLTCTTLGSTDLALMGAVVYIEPAV